MKLSYSTGLQEFEVEGGSLFFNPSDTAFAKRLYTAFESLSKLQEQGEKDNAEAAQDGGKLFEIIEAKEAEMATVIDSVFGEGSCKKIFPNVGIYAIADGFPVWANFLLAVMEIVEQNMDEQEQKRSPRFEMLKKKYGKYMRH